MSEWLTLIMKGGKTWVFLITLALRFFIPHKHVKDAAILLRLKDAQIIQDF